MKRSNTFLQQGRIKQEAVRGRFAKLLKHWCFTKSLGFVWGHVTDHSSLLKEPDDNPSSTELSRTAIAANECSRSSCRQYCIKSHVESIEETWWTRRYGCCLFLRCALAPSDYNSFAAATLSRNYREIDFAELILGSIKVIITWTKGVSWYWCHDDMATNFSLTARAIENCHFSTLGQSVLVQIWYSHS